MTSLQTGSKKQITDYYIYTILVAQQNGCPSGWWTFLFINVISEKRKLILAT